MFKSRIIVIPTASEAVSHLEWNSELENLFVRYTSGNKIYEEDRVTFEMFADLCNEANRRGSWGSALHYWKKDHKEYLEAVDATFYKDHLESLPERVKLNMIAMLSNDVGLT